MPILAEPTYTESSFAFGVTYHLTRSGWWWLAGIPYFPWIDEEGLLGWDVGVPFWGVSLFLQFKRAELFRYRGAGPCFRFPVYKPAKSDQHNRLRTWAMREPHTYYCAPCFTSGADLAAEYLQRTLLCSTIAIPLRLLPPIKRSDNRQHFVTFTEAGVSHFRSRPQDVQGVTNLADVIASVVAQDAEEENLHLLNPDYVATLTAALDAVTQDDEAAAVDTIPEPPDASRTAVLRARLRAELGIEWVVLPIRPA